MASNTRKARGKKARGKRGRFVPGNKIGSDTRWKPGQSGNPAGVSRHAEFEWAFYKALMGRRLTERDRDLLREHVQHEAGSPPHPQAAPVSPRGRGKGRQ